MWSLVDLSASVNVNNNDNDADLLLQLNWSPLASSLAPISLITVPGDCLRLAPVDLMPILMIGFYILFCPAC